MTTPTKIHRLAKPASVGNPPGKRQMLCGRYLTSEYTCTDSKVTCKVCIRATTSARTITRDRLAQ